MEKLTKTQYCPDIMISNLSSDIGPCNSGGI